MAEEAFQQWLRRKREQLRMEKKLKQQQKKLDNQASYAKTRIQCEEAYREWCKRKNEEANARRATSGGSSSIRSQSLERSWIQEKTRKLYTAYISK
ncbi:hypothetical protein Avbf_04447 [Armadillidium vulgare]|nr:hypothetical protein Avbf_04447 [Armadillidium vulgare]